MSMDSNIKGNDLYYLIKYIIRVNKLIQNIIWYESLLTNKERYKLLDQLYLSLVKRAFLIYRDIN